MNKFQTPYNYQPKKGQEFSKEENEYGYVYNKETKKDELKIIGKTNIYEKIQAGKDDADINKILKKNMTSVEEMSKQTQIQLSEEIIDITKMPKTIIEAHEYEKQAKIKLEQQKQKIEQLKIKSEKEAHEYKERQKENKQNWKEYKKWKSETEDKNTSFTEWKENIK